MANNSNFKFVFIVFISISLKTMITEDFCTEELVKLLLEKGCPLNKVIKQDRRPVYFTLPTDHPNWADCDAYYIPTHSQTMKWLREVHNIHIAVDRGIEHYFAVLTKLKPYQDLSMKNDVFDTYKEAVESTLKYCLTKLI